MGSKSDIHEVRERHDSLDISPEPIVDIVAEKQRLRDESLSALTDRATETVSSVHRLEAAISQELTEAAQPNDQTATKIRSHAEGRIVGGGALGEATPLDKG